VSQTENDKYCVSLLFPSYFVALPSHFNSKNDGQTIHFKKFLMRKEMRKKKNATTSWQKFVMYFCSPPPPPPTSKTKYKFTYK
jgi:hypothetical protein